MSPFVFATFAELESLPWFSRLGEPDLDGGEAARAWMRYVTSVEEAIATCGSAIWIETRSRAIDGLYHRVMERAPIAGIHWFTFYAALDAMARELIERRVRGMLPPALDLPLILDSIRLDLVGMGLECQYGDVVQPTFFAPLSYYYSKGHFPCGWDGGYPHGRVLVY